MQEMLRWFTVQKTQNRIQFKKTPDSKPEETSPDKFLGWSRMFFIGVGLWFAVFLYSLVSLWPWSKRLSGYASKLTFGDTMHRTKPLCPMQSRALRTSSAVHQTRDGTEVVYEPYDPLLETKFSAFL